MSALEPRTAQRAVPSPYLPSAFFVAVTWAKTNSPLRGFQSRNELRMISARLNSTFDPQGILAVILGGGAGTRLFPLTKDRAKPAVPLGGKYRLVDIPISSCINSDLRRVYVLTQFNSASLHQHIYQAYKFDQFSRGFIEILAAEQTLTDTSWYQGTADAVRKNLAHFMNHSFEHLLILSGDQLYRMDCRALIEQHIQLGAHVTVATKPVPRKDIAGLGIMQMNADFRITRFVEKPKDPAVQDSLRIDPAWGARLHLPPGQPLFLASMGIYVFSRAALQELLNNDLTDFGKHIIPGAIESHRVFAYIFNGAWEDIGTIRSFFEANLDMTSKNPQFDFYDRSAPIYTQSRFLPASRIFRGTIEQSLISDGCLINEATVRQSVVGIRSVIEEGSQLHRTVMIGSDYFEPPRSEFEPSSIPRIGIGKNTRIENAIIDKNARIGDHCIISPEGKSGDVDHAHYFIRDGIVVIPKNGVVPHGTRI